MSRANRPSDGPDPVTFANAVAAAVERIIAAREGSPRAPFAISPALAQPDVLDYSSGFGAKVFSKATEPLATTFSIEKPNIRVLINELQVRSETFGWNSLLNINIMTDDQPPMYKSLIQEHGQCSLFQVQQDSSRYMHTDTRKRQNNYQLFVCLTNSVDDNTKRLLACEEKVYCASGHPCGVTYLKLLIQKAEVDTRATAAHIRRNLNQLNIYMVKEAKHNIVKFNQHVNEQLSILSSRGESSNDIIINLFTGYLACSDKKFIEYIEKCQDEYEEGVDITYQSLMIKAEKKYQSRVLNDEWNSLSQEQEEIIALKAKVASLSERKTMHKQHNVKNNAPNPANKESKKPSNHKHKRSPEEKKNKDKWRFEKPTDGTKVKQIKGSTWHYCDKHQAWGRHKTEECRLTTNTNENIKAYTAMASLANIGINDVIEEPDKFQLNNQPSYYLTFLGTLLTAIFIFIATIRHNTEMIITRLHNSLLDIKGYCKSITTLSRNVMDSLKHCYKELPAKSFQTVTGNCNVMPAYDTDSFIIGIDNHASASMTNDPKDFIGDIKESSNKIKGIKGHLDSAMIGTVRWHIQDDTGQTHRFDLPGTYLVPDLPIRLLSPQHLAKEMNRKYNATDDTLCTTFSDRVILSWNGNKYKRTVPLNKSNVPIIRSAPGYKRYLSIPQPVDEHQKFAYSANLPSIGNEEGTDHQGPKDEKKNVPLDESEDSEITKTTPEAELYLWHMRLGHMPFTKLQSMAKAGDLPRQLAYCTIPNCYACLYGKATRIPWRTKSTLRSKILPTKAPGDCISIDQLESPTPGLIAQMKGTPTIRRYKYVTVMVDHFSRFTFVYLQETVSSEETLRAKKAFEQFASEIGIQIKHYHADNGRFADRAFINHAQQNNQRLTYCGVNAHFQNGIAEKRIRDLQDRARTMLIHASKEWPAAIDTCLWPYAIRLACDVDNATITKGTLKSRIELFGNLQIKPKLRHFHPFGCPAYVLNQSSIINKWEPKARVGIYLGLSPKHARSVHLILNPDTGLVSPQYHVKFDNHFQTVKDISVKGKWKEKCHFQNPVTNHNNQLDLIQLPSPNTNTQAPLDSLDIPVESDTLSPNQTETPALIDTAVRTRAGRMVKPTSRYMESQQQRANKIVAYNTTIQNPALYSEIDRFKDLDHPITYVLKATNDPDTLYLHEALKAKDSEEFKRAMVHEVQQHTNRKHWEPIEKKDLPPNTIILPAVWAMKRKRRIDSREVYKWKSRLNIGGHKMREGIHFDNTFSPVVSWQSVRLLLIIATVKGWATKQVDFVMAYTQADINKPAYMELPPGINFPNMTRETHCLRILKNLYGGKESGRTWFIHLRNTLTTKLGYSQSKFDECVFFNGSTIFFVYTDDGIFIDPSPKQINIRLNEMSQIFDIQDQGDLHEYLGIKIDNHSKGSLEMKQPHLIDSILQDLKLLNDKFEPLHGTKRKHLPSLTTQRIGPDSTGKPLNVDWNYRSVIGKLNYLEKSTRPDISFVVHQLARFVTAPKESHGHAVKHLGRYLLGTRDKGIILSPTSNMSLTCYVDADFAGNWDAQEASDNPDTARSRSGYIVFFSGAPLHWQSKMQTIISLSTAESELVALSEATRFVKSMMYLLEELNERGIKVISSPEMYCNVFEDNSAALEMSRVPKMRPRTRHINVMYHHFCSEVENKRIRLYPIKSDENIADILTKQQVAHLFVRHRSSILGW